MSQLLSKMFRNQSSNEFKVANKSKVLPPDFAQQILNNDIILVLSDYTNNEALKNLIQLYMLGVEHFREVEDRTHEYFQIKLKNIFTNPSVLNEQQQPKQYTPPQPKVEVPTINVNPPTYSFLNKPKTCQKQENNFLSFSFQEPTVDKFFQCGSTQNKNAINSQSFCKHIKNTESSQSDEEVDEEHLQQQKNIIEQEKEEKIKEIQNQVIEEQIIIQNEGRAKEIAIQFKKQERRISQQIEAGMNAQESSIQKRKEMRKLRSQFSLHNINKAQSTPQMKRIEQNRTSQDDTNCIPEEQNEIGSSKLSSNKKPVEVNQFQFNDECK